MARTRRTSVHRLWLRARAVRVAGRLALLLGFALGVPQGSGVTPTNLSVDLYSSHSVFAGVPIPAKSYVAVFDPQGVQCGEFDKTLPAGWYGIMPCYGDDPTTSGDEGPVAGERLRFTINGVVATPQLVTRNATPVPAGTPATWTQNHDRLEVDLRVPPRPPVTVTLPSGQPAQLRLDWQPVGAEVTRYEIWRSTAPYFAPGNAGAQQPGTVTPDGTAPLSWSAGAGVGDPGVNYTYRVRSLNALSQTVGISQAVAEFDFALYP
jgi:hypothetical protein